MKIHVIGGGPAGLYSAILLKRAQQTRDVTVFERTRADEAAGLGVVFSRAALAELASHDADLALAITESAVACNNIEIRFKKDVRRIGGNPFCALSRATLLALLLQQARKLGVTLSYGCEVLDFDKASRDADLVIAADGAGSALRAKFAITVQPSIATHPNSFCWLSSARPLDAFTFAFRETPYGIFIAHAYPYEANRSAWVIETDVETFARCGLPDKDATGALEFLNAVFRDELNGQKIVGNSEWRNFPVVRCARWSAGNVVLVGDAKATAHFSVGSGTRLALEDAIALRDALDRQADIASALAAYERERRPQVEALQRAGDASATWFENIRHHWNDDPVDFAGGLMSRARPVVANRYRPRAPAASHQ